MKKLTAILLSMTMALSLALPAFAEAAPAEAAPISAVLDSLFQNEAGSIGVIGGADGPTSIITSGPLGSFNLEGIDWSSMEGLDWGDLEEQLNYQRDVIKKEMGGVPGQVGVMVNGAYIQFPDAAPEVANGRTMVPVRALVEALGGGVDYEFAGQKDSVRLFIDKYTIHFTIGGTTAVRHTRGSDTGEADKTIEMDCAPYIKNGRTYVPVRFLADALGYEVGWDAFYETVILLDRDALAEDIDKDFTILNKVQANKSISMEAGKNYQADVKGNVTVTTFDTLNGDKTYKADLTAKQIFNTDAASAQMSLKLSDNALDDLEELLTEQYGADFEENAILFRAVAEGLDDMEVILTKAGSAWFRAKALDELAGEDNVWLAADLGQELGELAFAQAGDATIGKVLVGMMPCESVTEWGSAMEMVNMLNRLYGDDQFTTSGGTSTLTIDVDDMLALYEDVDLSADDIAEAKAAFKEYEITMKVDDKGGATVTCAMETNPQDGVPGMKMAMDVKQKAGNVTMSVSVHIANMGEVKLELTQTQQVSSDKPMIQPPAGATVVDSIEPLEP